jgi:hypothetical protein
MADEKPDPVADDPKVQEARIAQAIAEANQAELKALLPPAPTSKPLEGKVEVSDKSGFFGDLLAYAAMERAVDSLANVVPETAKSVLLVEDRNLVGSEWMKTLMEGQIEQHALALEDALSKLGQDKREVMADSVPGAIAAAPLIVGAVADLVGMFKTDYAMHGRDVTISTTALLAETTGKLAARGIDVKIDTFAFIAESAMLTSFASLREKLTNLRNAVARLNEIEVVPRQLEIDDLTKTIDAVEKAWAKAVEDGKATDPSPALDRLAKLRADRKEAAGGLAPFKATATQAAAVLAAADEFVKAAVTATGTAPPPILAAAVRQRLQGVTHVLFVATAAAGDEAVTRHGLFAKSGIVGYIGGCNVSYLILDVAADKVTGGSGSWVGHTRYDLKDGDLSPPTFARVG